MASFRRKPGAVRWPQKSRSFSSMTRLAGDLESEFLNEPAEVPAQAV